MTNETSAFIIVVTFLWIWIGCIVYLDWKDNRSIDYTERDKLRVMGYAVAWPFISIGFFIALSLKLVKLSVKIIRSGAAFRFLSYWTKLFVKGWVSGLKYMVMLIRKEIKV